MKRKSWRINKMEGTEKQIFYAKALLDGFEDKVKVRYAKTVIETSQNVVSDQDKTEYIISLNLFFNMFDEKLKDKKHYGKIRLITEFPRQFLKYYFLQRYFAYGTFGFIRAMILAYFRFLKVAKCIEYELTNKKNDK